MKPDCADGSSAGIAADQTGWESVKIITDQSHWCCQRIHTWASGKAACYPAILKFVHNHWVVCCWWTSDTVTLFIHGASPDSAWNMRSIRLVKSRFQGKFIAVSALLFFLKLLQTGKRFRNECLKSAEAPCGTTVAGIGTCKMADMHVCRKWPIW